MKEIKNPKEIEGVSFKVYDTENFFVCVSELRGVFIIFDSNFNKVSLDSLKNNLEPDLEEVLVLIGIIND